MLPPLTEREKKILFFVRLWQHKKRYSPTANDIGMKFGVRKQSIQKVLDSLRKKGYLQVATDKDWRHRSILFPADMTFPWGNESLPDELFSHMKPQQPTTDNGNKLQDTLY
jgi:hypothetical protein